MPYVTGTANDLTALRAALFGACTANGWTLSGEVLHKGAVYVRVQVGASYLSFLGGTGIDGSNNLTGAAPYENRLASIISGFSWPLTYSVFIGSAPDEVYFICNYNVDMYVWAAFGKSSVQGLSGTGAWVAASLTPRVYNGTISISSTSTGGTYICPALFWGVIGYYNESTSYIHHGIDGRGWSNAANATNVASATYLSSNLLDVLPNNWNGESMLLPIQACVQRTSGGTTSLVADLAHARYMRIDNHVPGEIITLGADRWQVFPWFKKNTAARNGGIGIDHTGTFGWAIRYDGP